MYRLVDQFFAHDGPVCLTLSVPWLAYIIPTCDQVRCLSTGPAGEIISGGQDSYLRRWPVQDRHGPIGQAASDLLGPPLPHSHWVVAATQILPGEFSAYPAGGIVTGCLDGVIRVFNIIDGEVAELCGHEKGVISFSWTQDRKLISGGSVNIAMLFHIHHTIGSQ